MSKPQIAPGNYNQMMANRAGICACGGTVAPGELMAWDAATKTICACVGCGLVMSTKLVWKLQAAKYAEHDHHPSARSRAETLVAARGVVARWEAKLAAGGTPEQQARRERSLATAREELVLAETEALGRKGERAWQKCSARDIELAQVRYTAMQERLHRAEVEERAEEAAYDAELAARKAG
jgi:hypothetical protein